MGRLRLRSPKREEEPYVWDLAEPLFRPVVFHCPDPGPWPYEDCFAVWPEYRWEPAIYETGADRPGDHIPQ
eukprot:8378924-Prorocentrum_lima.AAC.1